MRYLISLWLVGIALFIFSTNSQAADVVEISNHKTVKAGEKISPIEPVKPIEPKTNKSKFWQKRVKSKQQQNEVEPIASGWYIAMGVYVILSLGGFALAGLYFLVLAVMAYPPIGLAVLGLILLGIIGSILYAIKLFSAANNKEGVLKGWRFALGYIVGLLFTFSWLGVAISFFGVATAVGGIILPLAILIFNIIDHARYSKYLRTLGNNPQ